MLWVISIEYLEIASTACRIEKNVYIAIAQRKHQFIKSPQGADLVNTERDFYRMVKFQGVIGDIDGIHIPIIIPGGQDSARFVNRNGYYSINTQIECGTSMKVTNKVAR